MADTRGREGHYAFSFDRVTAALWDKYEVHQQVESVEVLFQPHGHRNARVHEQSSDQPRGHRNARYDHGSGGRRMLVSTNKAQTVSTNKASTLHPET